MGEFGNRDERFVDDRSHSSMESLKRTQSYRIATRDTTNDNAMTNNEKDLKASGSGTALFPHDWLRTAPKPVQEKRYAVLRNTRHTEEDSIGVVTLTDEGSRNFRQTRAADIYQHLAVMELPKPLQIKKASWYVPCYRKIGNRKLKKSKKSKKSKKGGSGKSKKSKSSKSSKSGCFDHIPPYHYPPDPYYHTDPQTSWPDVVPNTGGVFSREPFATVSPTKSPTYPSNNIFEYNYIRTPASNAPSRYANTGYMSSTNKSKKKSGKSKKHSKSGSKKSKKSKKRSSMQHMARYDKSKGKSKGKSRHSDSMYSDDYYGDSSTMSPTKAPTSAPSTSLPYLRMPPTSAPAYGDTTITFPDTMPSLSPQVPTTGHATTYADDIDSNATSTSPTQSITDVPSAPNASPTLSPSNVTASGSLPTLAIVPTEAPIVKPTLSPTTTTKQDGIGAPTITSSESSTQPTTFAPTSASDVVSPTVDSSPVATTEKDEIGTPSFSSTVPPTEVPTSAPTRAPSTSAPTRAPSTSALTRAPYMSIDEGCDALERGIVTKTNLPVDIKFYYELVYDEALPFTTILSSLEESIVHDIAPELLRCNVVNSGNALRKRLLISENGIVGVSPLPDDGISGTCQIINTVEPCFRVNGFMTVYLKENNISSQEDQARRETLYLVKEGMDSGIYVNSSAGVLQTLYLGPPLPGTGYLGPPAEAITKPETPDSKSLTGLGMAFVVCAAVGFILVILLAIRKRRSRNQMKLQKLTDDDSYLDDLSAGSATEDMQQIDTEYVEDAQQIDTKYIDDAQEVDTEYVRDLGTATNPLHAEERDGAVYVKPVRSTSSDDLARNTSETWFARPSAEEVAMDTSDASFARTRSEDLAMNTSGAFTTRPSMFRSQSAVDVHQCNSATCKICLTRKSDPTFVSVNSPPFVNRRGKSFKNSSLLSRTYTTDDTVDF